MKKNLVYSWRLDPHLKSSLEQAAREQETSIASLLEQIVIDWLIAREDSSSEDELQARLHAAAAGFAGQIHGDNSTRAENARSLVRQRLERRRAS